MDDSSNSSLRGNDCGEAEEEEEREQGTKEKSSTPPQLSTEGTSQSSVTSLPISSRQMRNLAEKHRRNKLNTCINELSQLVPFVSNSNKKVEKTSVLRLSAAYLRLHRLLQRLGEQREELPSYVKQINLAELLLDDKDIFLIVTSTGKIVFVSHSVESILGHNQTDLMGQSIFNIACPEDYEQIRHNLKYQESPPSSSSSSSSSESIRENDRSFNSQRRQFYIRLIKKSLSRGDQPEYKLVHVMGTLMVPKNGTKNSLLSGNDIVLNAVIRPYNDCRVTEVSLLEATKEEYITRHYIDGRIIYVDHRISIVSGFMPQEVCGKLAFTYMHRDDVRWVMIALRQMFTRGQSFGSSCYRLLSKNGEFVYMKTHGYLELNINEESIVSFICINSLVSPEEGEKEIIKMRERFTPIISSREEPGIAAISNDQYMAKDSNTSLKNAITEDPNTLRKVVKQMYTNIPAPAIDNAKETAQNPLPDSQYLKVVLLSKSLPPVPDDSSAPKIVKRPIISPSQSQTATLRDLQADRPTVLQIAPPSSSYQKPIANVVPQISENTVEEENHTDYVKQRGSRVIFLHKRQNDLSLISEHSHKKQKIVTETQIDSPTCSQYSNQMDGSLSSDNPLSADGYGSVEDFSSFQSTSIPLSLQSIDEHDNDLDSLNNVNMTGLGEFSNTLEDPNPSLFLTPESYNSFDNGVYIEGNSSDIIPDSLMHVLQHEGNLQNDFVQKTQITLQTKMDEQQGQLKEIKTGLNSLSPDADACYLNRNYSNLKAAHEKQNQFLLTLQEVHKNIDV